MGEKKYKSFSEFWPFYVGEHRHPANRKLHFVGTSFGFMCLLTFFWTLQALWILVGLVVGYAFAWVGHFLIEKNRPATFTYPLWSFAADWKMWFFILTGRMAKEVQNYAQPRP